MIYLAYDEDMQKYEIIRLGNGLREISGSSTKELQATSIDFHGLEIKNNDTGKNENLEEYMKAYLS